MSSSCNKLSIRDSISRAARLVKVRQSISLKATPSALAFLIRSARICVFPQPGGAKTKW